MLIPRVSFVYCYAPWDGQDPLGPFVYDITVHTMPEGVPESMPEGNSDQTSESSTLPVLRPKMRSKDKLSTCVGGLTLLTQFLGGRKLCQQS